MARAATTSDAFNAVAEPRRRDILSLSRRLRAAGQRHRRGAVPAQPSVSKHLRVLRDVGLVDVAARGTAGLLSDERAGDSAAPRVDSSVRAVLAQSTDAHQGARRDVRSRLSKGTLYMPALASALDNLTLSITQEILVRASLEKAFASLLEQLGPANEGMNGTPMPMTLEARPGRPLVPRSRRRQRPLLGRRPGDQAANAARDHRTAVHVGPRSFRTCSTASRKCPTAR